ncbi:DDE-type integrase/transposase/recombinase [Streptomyces sp. NPDC058439]|uniref:DDE-type integrase/transposase/recombinase n=1 Tax=Streptomyces sp. NPDC058439 TaxID=3346500 RepID=UPI003664382D
MDQDGTGLDTLPQSKRDAKAAKRFMAKLTKKQRRTLRVLVTDKLRSYGVAHSGCVGERTESGCRCVLASVLDRGAGRCRWEARAPGGVSVGRDVWGPHRVGGSAGARRGAPSGCAAASPAWEHRQREGFGVAAVALVDGVAAVDGRDGVRGGGLERGDDPRGGAVPEEGPQGAVPRVVWVFVSVKVTVPVGLVVALVSLGQTESRSGTL